MRIPVLLMLPALALAGCAAESRTAPTSSSRLSNGPSSTEPEAANSLPRGSATQAPLTPQVGNIGTTRVAPARTGY